MASAFLGLLQMVSEPGFDPGTSQVTNDMVSLAISALIPQRTSQVTIGAPCNC